MSDPTWSLLAKAQDDPTTIDEAIAAAITSHEADPEAHLGSGESLEVHRANDTLDHPAGAVLADKQSFTELVYAFDFSVLSVLGITGDVGNTDWPTASLYAEYGATNKSEAYLTPQIPAPWLVNDKDIVFQLGAYWDFSSTSFKSWLGIGLEDELPNNGFGFVLDNDVMKAVVAIGGTRTWSSAITVDTTVAHIYRAQQNAGLGKLYFFIDGVLVATLDSPGSSWDTDDGPRFGVRLTTTNDGNMRVSDLRFARSVI